MTQRTDQELQAQSAHVLWEFRQCRHLAQHIYDRRREGVAELVDPLDAAALEAFCLHSRALAEFLWRDRKGKAVHRNDALAIDWFDSETWRPEAEPEVLTEMREKTGWGLAHISYLRITPTTGWDHDSIFHHIASRLALFAKDASPARLIARFEEQAIKLNIGLRQHKSSTSPIFDTGIGEMPVATPTHHAAWLRRDPAEDSDV